MFTSFYTFVVLFLAVNSAHDDCHPDLAKLKSELSRKIDQSLYAFYDLQAQAKVNNNNIKRFVNKAGSYSVISDCFVEEKLKSLYGIIREYQKFYISARGGEDFGHLYAEFEKLKSEIEESNTRCLKIINNLCS